MFSEVLDFSLWFPFVVGLGFTVFHSIGRHLRERDIIKYFNRFNSRHNKNKAIDDLIKIKEGLEKHNMKEGWPTNIRFFRMPDEDLEVFNQIINEAISEAKEATEVTQIKQKIAVIESKPEKVIYKNYNWNTFQSGFYFLLLSRILIGYGVFNLFLRFFQQLNTLF
ncbi:MAG: hypothetical protein ACQEP3_01915 [Patescibacteria group bacterium]